MVTVPSSQTDGWLSWEKISINIDKISSLDPVQIFVGVKCKNESWTEHNTVLDISEKINRLGRFQEYRNRLVASL